MKQETETRDWLEATAKKSYRRAIKEGENRLPVFIQPHIYNTDVDLFN